MSKKSSLLIVGNDSFAVEETLRLSSNQGYNIRHAKDTSIGSALFDSFKPDAMMLAFSSNREALVFYAYLLTHSKALFSFKHICILMSDGKHAEEASQYCHNKIIDDYVILKPLFDTHRLGVSLSILNKLLPHIEFDRLLESRIIQITKVLGGVSAYMEEKEVKQFKPAPDDKANRLLQLAFKAIDMGNELPNSDAEDASHERASHQSHDEAPLILLVEDEEVNQNMMRMVLEKEHYRVELARDGEEALEILGMVRPDLILMDIRMPKLNGLEVTKKIQQNPLLSSIPIVMLSAHSEQPVVRECLRSGAVDYLIKPAERRELLDRIHRFAGVSRHKLPEVG